MTRGVLAFVLFFSLWSCAARPVDRTPWAAAPDPEAIWFQTGPPAASHLLRHAVRLRVPAGNLDLSFDGVMRLDPGSRTARVVALGGFGFKLFDLEIGMDSLRIHALHPSVAHMDRLPEHVAFCVRRIWLGFGPSPADGLVREENSARLYGRHGGVFLEHEMNGNLRTATRASGPDEFWELVFAPGVSSTQEPDLITFTDEDIELTIRLVDKVPVPPGH